MISTALKGILNVLIGIWVLLAVACVFLISVGTDEAWVLNGLRSTLEPPVENLSSPVVLTSGGVFALANIGLEWTFGSVVWIHRLFSLLCLLGLVFLVFRLGFLNSSHSWTAGCLAVAPLLGLPGTAEVGTFALGTSVACLLMVTAISVWTRFSSPGPGRALTAGLLIGLAAASRTETVLVVPVMLAFGTIRFDDSGRVRIRLPRFEILAVILAFATIALTVMLSQQAPPVIPVDVESSTNDASAIGLAGGLLGGLLDYPRTLNKLLIAQGFGPLILVVLASALPFWQRSVDPAENRFSALMIGTAWAVAAGWVLRSPIPHLRYLWPSLVCFSVPAGLALSRLYDQAVRVHRSNSALIYLLLASAFLAGGIGLTLRSVVLGDEDILSWEWSREMGVDYFRRFQALQDQRDAVDYVKTQLPPDAMIFSSDQPYILRYLTHRPIIDLSSYIRRKKKIKKQPRSGKIYMVIPPAVGTYLYITPKAFEWYEAHGRLAAQFGRYSICEIPAGWPADIEMLQTPRANYVRHPLSKTWFGR